MIDVVENVFEFAADSRILVLTSSSKVSNLAFETVTEKA
jgi:hypothetical protein